MDERVIVTYDITDDRRRNRICKAIERYGDRVQYSVFEIAIATKDLHKLIDELHGLMHTQEDRLLVIRLCSGCQAIIGRYGNMASYEPVDTLII